MRFDVLPMFRTDFLPAAVSSSWTSSPQQVAYPDQIAFGHRQLEFLFHPLQSPEHGLSETAYHLAPAEALFDELAFVLAHCLPGVSSGTRCAGARCFFALPSRQCAQHGLRRSALTVSVSVTEARVDDKAVAILGQQGPG